ncbi:MAG: Sua5/YciO/YrdC/YwlC family protein [Candidatus Moranbacteria bacterium]|nr:Sua5/YciO/YrdC/YwlC family protein [Candidatus Moranbacteria bacterium]
MNEKYKKAVKVLKKGEIVVLPSDTIYGIFGSALNKDVVEKVYKLRKRRPSKPMIILISSVNDLKKFNIDVNQKDEIFSILQKGGVSVVFSCEDKKFKYLHRGTKSLAFRIPNGKNKRSRMLKDLLKKTGPLVAPSANFEGELPAETLTEAKGIFGESVDFYIGEGRRLSCSPSTLVRVVDGEVEVLRGRLK